MTGCCDPRGCDGFFTQRMAHRAAKRYREHGLDKTARRLITFLEREGIEEATVLEIGGGVGEVQIELLKLGAARTLNLELSAAYEDEAAQLLHEAGAEGTRTSTHPRHRRRSRRNRVGRRSCAQQSRLLLPGLRTASRRSGRPCEASPGVQLSTSQRDLAPSDRSTEPHLQAARERVPCVRPPAERDVRCPRAAWTTPRVRSPTSRLADRGLRSANVAAVHRNPQPAYINSPDSEQRDALLASFYSRVRASYRLRRVATIAPSARMRKM